ncbi:Formylglycine-generating enzyme, required for sulfatase activity, contains SUMF1/FGE domain [Nannocystis exedens]|uniref:Formylglycine-generating enzyme, required for sulfatase activity, contains SUMF1/FGE domain n=1 Tax=Nannocystis exedens TaxID=54 RepID=A0A1I1YUR3_9BACT|nr:SUMF1/EgtB/PvdO family nonheme iron enzyme [Nannocystis exedens]PCC70128.1 Formylglycine-generating sulfatase enzyme [Nannocystis exedens]SFE23181.1 Formylglycine-generating enzyme, required for sulfatase activity, contains SUMF1/FGE domain [Nannocystis exedens]
MKRRDTAKMADLLRSIFEKDELRGFMMLNYKEIHDSIRWDSTHQILAAEVAAALERHGRLDDEALRAALKAERPARAREIAELRGTRRVLPALLIGAVGLGLVVVGERGMHAWSPRSSESGMTTRERDPEVAQAQATPAAQPCPEDMVEVVPDPRIYRGEEPFCLDVHEVSRGRYGLTCPPSGRGGVHEQVDKTFAQYCDSGAPDPRWSDYPVVMITAAEAQSFCEQQGRRLPTTRERKIAAAMEMDSQRVGESLRRMMNLCGAECRKPAGVTPFVFHHRDEYERLAPVGSFRDRFPSRLGLADLFGNAREIAMKGDLALACGGSWQSYDKSFLSPELCDAERTLPLGALRLPDVGFRCARDVSSETGS